ncbi:MAG: 50S ribosomal protein L29 [Rhodobacteraceae bacterium]|nr:50S ribosomal protein L29 [Paracoccaceae bacterium]MCY4195747.1 50S ribosomal protein L29 [Paracoccaceae bacterium]
MDAAEMREKSADELTIELIRLKRESFNLRFRRTAQEFNNTARIREVRRETARVKTVLGEMRRARPDSGSGGS